MPLHACLTCGTPTPGSRCEQCRNVNTSERGYGSAHQALRRALLPAAYGQPCPRCGLVMELGQALDLGHSEDRSEYTGMEHATCNRRAGAAKANSQWRPARHQ